MKKGVTVFLTTALCGLIVASIVSETSAGDLIITPNATHMGKIVIISPLPGQSTVANGAALLSVLGGITDAAANNQYVLRLGPGVYDLGGNSLSMQEYVDIEGSGENTTVITGTVSNGASPASVGVVNGADHAELRFLTVSNTGQTGYTAAILNNGKSPRITHVTAAVSGAASENYGVFNTSSASPMMTDVTVSASGAGTSIGVLNDNSSPKMRNVSISVTGTGLANLGVENASSSAPEMTNVSVSTTAPGGTNNFAIFNDGSTPGMNDVIVNVSGGSGLNYGVNNNSSSPTMTNVNISVSGDAGSDCIGIFNSFSSPSLTRIKARATGGSNSTGISNQSSSPTMTDVIAKASGGTTNSAGISNIDSSPIMTNVTATAENGALNYGMVDFATTGSYTIFMDRSTFSGVTFSVMSDATYTFVIGATKFAGTKPDATATYHCVGSYFVDGSSITPLGADCQ